MHQHLLYRGPRRRGQREKGPQKIFEAIIAENFPNMGKGIVSQVQEAQSPRQDKLKEEHPKTHSSKMVKTKFSSVQFSCSVVSNSLRPHELGSQASLSITNSQSPPKPMSIESVMPSNLLILCHPLLPHVWDLLNFLDL